MKYQNGLVEETYLLETLNVIIQMGLDYLIIQVDQSWYSSHQKCEKCLVSAFREMLEDQC